MTRRISPCEQWLISQDEADFQMSVLKAARALGWTCHHAYDSRASTGAGFPDLVLCRPPRVLFAELKRERGQLSVEQFEWLTLLGDCPGVEAFCWRPRDMDRIVEILQGDG